MTELIWLRIIDKAPELMTAGAAVGALFLTWRNGRKIAPIVTAALAPLVVKVEGVEKRVEEVHHATNGMKADLEKAADAAGVLRGEHLAKTAEEMRTELVKVAGEAGERRGAAQEAARRDTLEGKSPAP